MVLNLHTRLAHMKNCAIILVSSLPTAWIAVGALLLILALVMTVLFLLKSREVATLKKQCEDLQDTMRMMRYEEANMARMLHTANKPAKQFVDIPVEEPTIAGEAVDLLTESVALIAEGLTEETSGTSEAVSEESLGISSEESSTSEEDTLMAETTETEVCIEQAEQVEDDEPTRPIEAGALVEPLAEESTVETPLTEVTQIETPKPHKQPINERRPAIPTDLFSAWFAENEEVSVAEETVSQEEPDATECSQVEESPAVSDELAAVVEASMTEESQTDTPQAMAEVPQENVSTNAGVPAQDPELSKDDERFCRKLERIVNTRLHNPNLNIDIIAAQFGIGRTNFYRKVRELMGMSPNDYLKKCRMERAAELLGNPEMAINEVCAQVGIPDAQYFSRVFKMHFGVSPSVYREKQ